METLALRSIISSLVKDGIQVLDEDNELILPDMINYNNNNNAGSETMASSHARAEGELGREQEGGRAEEERVGAAFQKLAARCQMIAEQHRQAR